MKLLYFLVICFLAYALISSHPQCEDSNTPFKVKGKGFFCNRFKIGCCTRNNHNDIKAKYNFILAELNKTGIQGCDTFLKDILCQRCSPLAAHVYEGQASFPDLCPAYCSNLFDKCKIIISYITNDSAIIDSLDSKEAFCNIVNIKDTIYCWPDILNNSALIPNFERHPKTVEGCLCLKELASGLRNPVRLISPKDGTRRIFVIEQLGLIWIYNEHGVKVTEPFLDMSARVKFIPRQFGKENGLLGMAFHNNFKENGRVFLHYTIEGDGGAGSNVLFVTELLVSNNDMNKLNISTERILLQVKQPSRIHNAGQLITSLDGYLYVFLGDGGPLSDKFNNAQNRNTLLGSILRIDVDSPTLPYGIPSDNPFVGVPNVRPEIYAYGFRNPWRGDEDEGDPETGYGRGRIIFGDVGQARFEEVDILMKGGNYGWRAKEGKHCANYGNIKQPEECDALEGKDIEPIVEYTHAEFGDAITPGHIYRGCHSPALNGIYIFGSHSDNKFGGQIFTLNETVQNSNVWESKKISLCEADICSSDKGLSNEYERFIMGFGEDFYGEVYLLTSNTRLIEQPNGKIYRIVEPNRRGDLSKCRVSTTPVNTTTTPTVTVTTSTPSGR